MTKTITSATGRKLSERYLGILNFVHQHTLHEGYAPTLREIGSAVGISSTSVVDYYLRSLTQRGYVRRTQGASRSVLLLEAGYRVIGQPMPHELQAELGRLLLENHHLREQCERLQRERDRLLTATAVASAAS